jgi:hypothetical protein
VFCSDACRTIYEQAAFVERICGICQQPFLAMRSAIKRSLGLYCSRPCYYVSQKRGAAERFWSKVQKTDTCWLWQGAKAGGYGYLSGGQRNRCVYAHRYAWTLVGGKIPAKKDVCHTCDVRNCVRNDEVGTYEVNGVFLPRWGHLFLGSRLQNLQDASQKGRMPGQRKRLSA